MNQDQNNNSGNFLGNNGEVNNQPMNNNQNSNIFDNSEVFNNDISNNFNGQVVNNNQYNQNYQGAGNNQYNQMNQNGNNQNYQGAVNNQYSQNYQGAGNNQYSQNYQGAGNNQYNQMNQNGNNQNFPMNQGNFNNQFSSNSNENEMFLRSFIGDNYEKITADKSFNFPAFFLTSTYLLYRKMFLYGILCFIVELLVLNFIDINVVTLGFKFLIGMFVNKAYIKHANRKIEKIRLRMVNSSFEEILKECSKKGGTSILFVILGTLVHVVIFVLFIIGMLILGFATIFSEILKESTNGTYNGILIYDTSINMEEEYSIEVPDGFENNSSDYSYEYEYSPIGSSNSICYVSLNVPKGYSDANDLINQMSDYFEEEATSTQEIVINNKKWYWILRDDEFGKVYYYGTTNGGNVYLLEYSADEEVLAECESIREDIINSVKEK